MVVAHFEVLFLDLYTGLNKTTINIRLYNNF